MPPTPEPPLGQIMRALAFAAFKHRDQRRKDIEASPYINHPIALAAVLADECAIDDPDVICAAILHDTIEDTKTTPEELARNFGTKIAGIVAEVTDNKDLPSEDRKRLQIEHAGTISREARLVKLADKICNLRDVAKSPPAKWSLERKQEYFDWAVAVIAGLRGTHPQLESLFDQAATARPK
jgi:guanosine-3',5'-bis(diphosphate) 3'-pyrophosphohydrolase